MQKWLSFHFYPLEVQDVFLIRAVKPFLEQYIWPETGARAFFVRYVDEEGPHIRLRLRGEEEWLESTIRPAIETHFANRGNYKEVAYVAETARFGGAESMAQVEEFFHISTRVVLDRLSKELYTYGDAMFDALRMHIITVIAAGFDRQKASWYFERLCEQWIKLFFRPDDGAPADEALVKGVLDQFRQSFEPQRDDLYYAVTEFWRTVEAGKFDNAYPEWLRWVRGNELVIKELEGNLDKTLPSLLHLTNNRLGINNQDEAHLCFILANTL